MRSNTSNHDMVHVWQPPKDGKQHATWGYRKRTMCGKWANNGNTTYGMDLRRVTCKVCRKAEQAARA